MNAVTTEVKRGPSVLEAMAERYGMTGPAFEATVRAVAISSNATKEEFAAFLLVAKEYRLNPLTREIYAFPKKGGGIVPIVSIDGWVSLVNSHAACDGFEFEFEHAENGDLVSCTCKMYRKDRGRPVTVTEFFSECVRPTDPWKMKHRMLRHKSLTQAARYAFGFSGVYDAEEGADIAEMPDITPTERPTPPKPPAPKRKDEPKAETRDEGVTIDHAEEEVREETAQGEPQEPADGDEPFDLSAYLDEIETALAVCNDEISLEEAWNEIDAESVLQGQDDNAAIALAIYKRNRKRVREGAK